jgi:hypothetical protein
MKYALIPVILAGLLLCALSTGCTSPTQTEMKPVETLTALPTVSPSTATSTAVSTPVQVETLSAEQDIDLQLSKERPDYTLHLLYNGGRGEVAVQSILMRATLADGKVVEQYMADGARKPRRGDEIVIPGTRGSGIDRVEVFVTSAGRTYKVMDRPVMTAVY